MGCKIFRFQKGWKWGGWIVAAAFYLYDVFIRLSVDVTVGDLESEFNITASAVTSYFSSSFFYAYAAVQLPVGIGLDFLGPRFTLMGASVFCTIGSVLFSFARVPWVGMVGRVLTGMGCGCGWLGAIKVCRVSFGSETRLSRIMVGVTCMLGGFGGLVSQYPLDVLARHVGWRHAFQISALLPVLIAVGAAFFVGDSQLQMEHKGRHTPETPLDAPLMEKHSPEPLSKTLCSVLRTFATTPRMWLYALYLGGTDAPFETFCGVWGDSFLRQVVGWSADVASTGTMLVVIVATAAQLLGGPLLLVLSSRLSKLVFLALIALVGVSTFAPALIAPAYIVTDPWVYTSLVALGLTVGSCTVIWSVISSDPLCNSSRTTGVISGATNTLVIAIDAMVQQAVGVFLSVNWDGRRALDGNGKLERVFSASAYAQAFATLSGAFALATVCISLASCLICGGCDRKRITQSR